MNIGIQLRATEDTVVLIPTISITAGRCEDPECGAIHGFEISLFFLCWDIALLISL